MGDQLLIDVWRYLLPIPLRNFVVKELLRLGHPMPPEYISQALDLPQAQVIAILDDLEKHLTFLFRNPQGAVSWAYPVTVDVTPHRLSLSSGETGYAA